MSSHSDYLEQRSQPPVWFHAPSTIQSEGEALCQHCGLAIIPGELIAEVDGDGMEFVHESCTDEDWPNPYDGEYELEGDDLEDE